MRQSLIRASKAAKLSVESIQRELDLINLNLPNPRWVLRTSESDEGTRTELEGNYRLKTFAKTWEFLNTAAMHSQKARHHPTITTTYNRIKFTVTTHDVGNQITKKDIKLAQAIELSYSTDFAEVGGVAEVKRQQLSSQEAAQIINDLTKKQ